MCCNIAGFVHMLAGFVVGLRRQACVVGTWVWASRRGGRCEAVASAVMLSLLAARAARHLFRKRLCAGCFGQQCCGLLVLSQLVCALQGVLWTLCTHAAALHLEQAGCSQPCCMCPWRWWMWCLSAAVDDPRPCGLWAFNWII